MTEDRKGISLFHLAVGAGIVAAAAVGVAAFVPKRRRVMAGDALRGALEWPGVGAVAPRATSLWIYVSVVPLALIGGWAALRMTGTAQRA